MVWTGFLYNWSFQSLVCDWIKLEKIVFTLLNTFNCLEFHDLIVLFYIRALWIFIWINLQKISKNDWNLSCYLLWFSFSDGRRRNSRRLIEMCCLGNEKDRWISKGFLFCVRTCDGKSLKPIFGLFDLIRELNSATLL